MSIKNNILNNFLSTATISALALGGLASVALAPIVVDATSGTLEIRETDLTDSTFYHVCRYDMSNSDLDPDGDGTNVSLSSTGTTMQLSDQSTADFTLDTKVDVAPVAAGEYQLSAANEITVWDTNTNAVAPVTLTAGQYLMDEDGTTFVSDGTNLFSVDLADGENASGSSENAPLTEKSDFRVDNDDSDSLLVLLELSGPESAIESAIDGNKDIYCEYDESGGTVDYNPLSNLQAGTADAILVDGEVFNDDEDDFELLVSVAGGFANIAKLQAGQSDTPGEIANEDLNVSSGDKEEITKSDLEFAADGASDSQIIYTVIELPEYGSLVLDRGNGQKDTLVKDSMFSQQNINNGDLEYVHNGDSDDDDEFKFKVHNADKDDYENYTTSEKTMEIKLDETNADFKVCGDFETKVGQDQGDRVILSKGVVKICDSAQTDEGEIDYTITADADTGSALGIGTNVVIYKDDGTVNNQYDAGEEESTFTLEEVEDGEIVIELLNTVADNVSSETMTVTISDNESNEDAEGVTLKFTFEDNTDPFVVNNTLNLGGVNQSATITENDLKVDDGDDDYLNLVIEVTSVPAFGILKKDNAPLTMGSTFEMEDIKDGKISYENTLDTSLDTVGFKATDPSGDDTGFTFRVNVTGGTTPSDCDFSDVPSSQTFNKEICGLKEKGVVGGYPDGSYGPNNNVTRGEMSKFVVKAFNMAEDTSCDNFPDAVGNTFEKEISTLKCQGVVGGNNGKYLPNDSITRGEAMKIVVKAAESKGLTLDMTISEGFADVPMDQTFYNEIYKAYSNGIAGGQDGNFYPERTITRGEMSKIVYNTHLMLVEKGLF